MYQLAKSTMVHTATRLASRPVNDVLARLFLGRPNVLHVLTYHRIDEPQSRPDLCPSTLSASPVTFAAHMECVRRNFHVVNLAQVRSALDGESELPARSVLITFDDAYLDFAAHAWPVLKRMNLPATMFVPTAFATDPGRVFWWDQLHRITSHVPRRRRLESMFGTVEIQQDTDRLVVTRRIARRLAATPHNAALDELNRLTHELDIPECEPAVMDWRDLELLEGEGLTLAPHTQTHPLMNRIPPEQARLEVQASQEELAKHVNHDPRSFAYPGGAVAQEHLEILKQAGIDMAFTTRRGANAIDSCQRLLLHRINVGQRATCQLLRTQLLMPPWLINRLSK